jgi:small subunit ribosomal protein S3Ae
MAKSRSRAAARKVKDKWKAKTWYNVLAPESFDNVTVAETLADESDKLIKRVSEVSLQDITNDFRKSHIKLFFEINEVEGTNAHTRFIGHTLTSDYLRRMIRRKRSKVDGIYDVLTRDGARIRIKPFATTDHRIQNSQKKIIRDIMKKTIAQQAKKSTLSEFVKIIIDGKIGSEIYKNCKKIYPVKRVEIYKTHVISHPTVTIKETKKPEPKDVPTGETEEKTKEEEKEDKKKTDENIGESIESKEQDMDEDTIDDKSKKIIEDSESEEIEVTTSEEQILNEKIEKTEEEILEEKSIKEETIDKEDADSSEKNISVNKEKEESLKEKKKK